MLAAYTASRLASSAEAVLGVLSDAARTKSVPPEQVEGALLSLEQLQRQTQQSRVLSAGPVPSIAGKWRLLFGTGTKIRAFQYIPVKVGERVAKARHECACAATRSCGCWSGTVDRHGQSGRCCVTEGSCSWEGGTWKGSLPDAKPCQLHSAHGAPVAPQEDFVLDEKAQVDCACKRRGWHARAGWRMGCAPSCTSPQRDAPGTRKWHARSRSCRRWRWRALWAPLSSSSAAACRCGGRRVASWTSSLLRSGTHLAMPAHCTYSRWTRFGSRGHISVRVLSLRTPSPLPG